MTDNGQLWQAMGKLTIYNDIQWAMKDSGQW